MSEGADNLSLSDDDDSSSAEGSHSQATDSQPKTKRKKQRWRVVINTEFRSRKPGKKRIQFRNENSLKNWKKQGTIPFQKAADPAKKQARKAEVIAANFLIQHNLPLATADHLGPLFR